MIKKVNGSDYGIALAIDDRDVIVGRIRNIERLGLVLARMKPASKTARN
jgi:hypothetical protein